MKEIACTCIKAKTYQEFDGDDYNCVEYTFTPCESCPGGIEMNVGIGQGGDLDVSVTLKLEILDLIYMNNYRGMQIELCISKHGLQLKRVYDRIKADHIKFMVDNKTLYVLTWDAENPVSCFGRGSGSIDDPDVIRLSM